MRSYPPRWHLVKRHPNQNTALPGGEQPSLLPLPEKPAPPKIRSNVLLFLATVLTTTLFGATISGVDPYTSIANFLQGLPYSASLLGILIAHEMGHYLVSRYHRVPASLPYFIPMPPPFFAGTLGAIIRMRGLVRTRSILFDIGIAGPLAGMCVAVPVTLIGLHCSTVVDIVADSSHISLELGDSMLFKALTTWTFGTLPDTKTVLLHPVAFAGWLGFLVTSLNLLPMGQLDGGHVTYGIFGPHHRILARIIFVSLISWGVHGAFLSQNPTAWLWAAAFCSVGLYGAFSQVRNRYIIASGFLLLVIGILGNYTPGTTIWLVWSLLLVFLRLEHPPTRDISIPLDPTRRALGWFALLIFLLTFTPQPIHVFLPE